MWYNLKRRVYESSPAILKRVCKRIPYRWLAGRVYRQTAAECKTFESATREELLAYQEEALGKLLAFATDQVPAYRRFRRIVERLPALEALKAFPLIDKADLRNDPERYLPKNLATIPHRWVATGGTSGYTLKFCLDDSSYSKEMAFVHEQWRRVSYAPHYRKATFRVAVGQLQTTFPKLDKGMFWRENPIHNELMFSPFHMNEETLGAYVEQLLAFGPSFLHGYPSAIDRLAEYVLRNDLQPKMPVIKAVLAASEACSPHQRRRMEQAFRARVYTFYGHSERVLLGGECKVCSYYHQFPNYGILEITREDGTRAGEGESGDLVGTGLLNQS